MKLLPHSDEPDASRKDQWLAEKMEEVDWPISVVDFKDPGVRDRIFRWMGDILKIDYLATRYDITTPYYNRSGSQFRGELLDTVATTFRTDWERAHGVYLFRDKYWPLKRRTYTGHAFPQV